MESAQLANLAGGRRDDCGALIQVPSLQRLHTNTDSSEKRGGPWLCLAGRFCLTRFVAGRLSLIEDSGVRAEEVPPKLGGGEAMASPLALSFAAPLIAFLANAGAHVALGAPAASGGPQASGVWGHIYCDPSMMGGLSISLNGMPLRSATVLPALPSKSSQGLHGMKRGGAGAPPSGVLQQTAEFQLPPLLPGAYLLEVLHPDLIFPKYRAVVNSDGSSSFDVYPLNAFLVPSTTAPLAMPLKVGPLEVAHYTPPQGGFSMLDLLRQPLVILVLISLGLMYIMPKLQLEDEQQQVHQPSPHHREEHVVSVPYAETPEESVFVAKLMRHSRAS
ncbi:hypothetical protein Efla_005596 [Eimeria flavescens]